MKDSSSEVVPLTKEIKNITPYIFDIQRFSLHDGPGIRTALFLKGCPMNCLWCQNPESQRRPSEIAFYYEKCVDCRKCIDNCPENAIDPESRKSSFEKCIRCEKCVELCDNDARRVMGKLIDNEKLIAELLEDIDFYNESGGGVTFSGGEPFHFPEYLYEILKRLQEKKIHINIETCGLFKMEKVLNLLPFIQLIFFDLKHMNDAVHKEYTGVSNQQIIKNFEHLSDTFPNVQPRIPLIPEINDNQENIKETSEFLLKNNHHTIHLLPYHNLGYSKLLRIDSKQKGFKTQAYDDKKLKHVLDLFNGNGIKTVCYD